MEREKYEARLVCRNCARDPCSCRRPPSYRIRAANPKSQYRSRHLIRAESVLLSDNDLRSRVNSCQVASCKKQSPNAAPHAPASNLVELAHALEELQPTRWGFIHGYADTHGAHPPRLGFGTSNGNRFLVGFAYLRQVGINTRGAADQRHVYRWNINDDTRPFCCCGPFRAEAIGFICACTTNYGPGAKKRRRRDHSHGDDD